MAELSWNGKLGTYPDAEPPVLRGAPVSPSAILRAMEENEREARARFAVVRGRVMDWRSMVKEG